MPAIRSSSSSSTGPSRSTGGAANASAPSPPSVWRTGTSPAPHSWIATPGSRLAPPAASHAWQVPSVGCPAKGSSAAGVKIRTR